jgi:MFS transporter, DHA1 family, tetracycline resistance protein
MNSAESGCEAPKGKPRRSALACIFITVAPDMLALGLIVPVLPKVVEDFLHDETALAPEYVGLFGMVWTAMQLLFSSPWHCVRSFRKKPNNPTVQLRPGAGLHRDGAGAHLWWLFAGRAVSAITSASLSTTSAYIADVAPPEEARRELWND